MTDLKDMVLDVPVEWRIEPHYENGVFNKYPTVEHWSRGASRWDGVTPLITLRGRLLAAGAEDKLLVVGEDRVLYLIPSGCVRVLE